MRASLQEVQAAAAYQHENADAGACLGQDTNCTKRSQAQQGAMRQY